MKSVFKLSICFLVVAALLPARVLAEGEVADRKIIPRSEPSDDQSAPKASQPRHVWVYKVEDLSGMTVTAVEEKLNELGAQGWELVSISGQAVAYFKKEKDLGPRRRVIRSRNRTASDIYSDDNVASLHNNTSSILFMQIGEDTLEISPEEAKPMPTPLSEDGSSRIRIARFEGSKAEFVYASSISEGYSLYFVDSDATNGIQVTRKRLRQKPSTSAFQSVDFTLGPKSFREGDSIIINEVESRSGSLDVGNEVIVRGAYELKSRSDAKVAVFVTQTKGDGKSETLPGQKKAISEEKGEFELRIKIRHEGYLHVSFYPEDSGSGFGGVYFGDKDGMGKIEQWDLSYYLEDEPNS